MIVQTAVHVNGTCDQYVHSGLQFARANHKIDTGWPAEKTRQRWHLAGRAERTAAGISPPKNALVSRAKRRPRAGPARSHQTRTADLRSGGSLCEQVPKPRNLPSRSPTRCATAHTK